MINKRLLNQADEPTRRNIAQGLACSLLGMNFVSDLSGGSTASAATTSRSNLKGGGKAKSVIMVQLTGGISHVDSFDIKEANKVANDKSEPIKSNVSGIRVGKYFKKLAGHMDKFAVINSMHHTQGVHGQGIYLMKKGYVQRGTVEHPDLGAWVSRFGERRSGDIPPFVKIGNINNLGVGFFSSKYASLPISNPDKGLRYAKPIKGVAGRKMDKRLNLLKEFNQDFAGRMKDRMASDYHDAYTQALKLMKSKDLEVFNLNGENSQLQSDYGTDTFGRSCLLARRLVEQGVSFIQVSSGGWDDHFAMYDEFGPRAATLDQTLSTLMADLESRGLLDSTLVAVTTEFGRGATLGGGGGRGHNPAGYTCMLAGGGIQGGQKYGATDAMGHKAVKDKVGVGDYHTTIAYAMGLPYETVVMSPQARPFQIGNRGSKPLTALF